MFGLLQDSIYEEHDTGAHPERVARLGAIRQGIHELETTELVTLSPVRADVDSLCLVHEREYVRRVKTMVENGSPRLDADTAVCPRSYDVALHAVGGALAGIDAIMKGRLKQAFFAVRPPGHHAEEDRAMGFCLFNNIAIAARHLIRRHGLDRVAIFDFDVHHGNGTMHTFYSDSTVFYGSVHQWPYYPGTGRTEERGRGDGLNCTLNIPYPAGAGDEEYETAIIQFGNAMERFKPQFLLVSAGYDAHWSDPLAGHRVTEQGYVGIVDLLNQIAATHCDGRLALFLEGGYNLDALRKCVSATVKTLTDTLAQAD